jgi:sugar phosphate isomerase/epimerase
MELSVLVEPSEGLGFRATSGDPLPATAEGKTRAEALDKLRDVLNTRVRAGAEVVRLHIGAPSTGAIWPPDRISDAWLAGIADARRRADETTDAWDAP